MSFESQYPTSY